MRRKKHETQRWVEGIRSAIEILDQSDPGFHYHNPVNVQNSSVRTSNANLIASFDIVARPVMPLKLKNTNSKFMWLLHGTYDEQRRIHGGTGVSPKLLHIFSQITLLAVNITKVCFPQFNLRTRLLIHSGSKKQPHSSSSRHDRRKARGVSPMV